MAVDILLNEDGTDIDITNGVMRLTPDIQTSSRQQALISLRTYLGEWAFNISDLGIPYLANDNNPIQLLGAGENKSLIDSFIKREILKKENITEITEYTSVVDKETGTMAVSFRAITRSGEVVSINDATLS